MAFIIILFFKSNVFIIFIASFLLIYQKLILKSLPLMETLAISSKFKPFCIKSSQPCKDGIHT